MEQQIDDYDEADDGDDENSTANIHHQPFQHFKKIFTGKSREKNEPKHNSSKKILPPADLPKKLSSTHHPHDTFTAAGIGSSISDDAIYADHQSRPSLSHDEEERMIFLSMPQAAVDAVTTWFTISHPGPDRTQEQCDEEWLQVLRSLEFEEVFQLAHYIYKFAIPLHDFNQDAEAACSSAMRLNKLHRLYLKEQSWFEPSPPESIPCVEI